MEMMPIKPERKAQLEAYAQRHGQDLAAYLEEEQRDYDETVEGVRRGYAGYKAGRTRPVAEVFEELRGKHDLPR